MGVRKRETERIEKENHAFAKRLFDKQAVLNKKALDNEYHNHLKYRRQIQKMAGGKKPGQGSVFGSDARRQTAGAYSATNINTEGQQYQ